MNVLSLYNRHFPASPLVKEDADELALIPVESTCGDDCRAAIEAAASLARHVRSARGRNSPEEARLASIAAGVCLTYACG